MIVHMPYCYCRYDGKFSVADKIVVVHSEGGFRKYKAYMQDICLDDTQKKPKGDMWTYAYKHAKFRANMEQKLCNVMHVRFKYTEDKYVTEKCGNQYILMKHFQDFFLKLHDKSSRGVGQTKSVKFDDYPALQECINKAEEFLKQNSDWFEKRYKKRTDDHDSGVSTLRDEDVSPALNNNKTSTNLYENISSNSENIEQKAANKPKDYILNITETVKRHSTSSSQSDMSTPPIYKDLENPNMATSLPEGAMLEACPSDSNIFTKSAPFSSPYQNDNNASLNDSLNNNHVQINMPNTRLPVDDLYIFSKRKKCSVPVLNSDETTCGPFTPPDDISLDMYDTLDSEMTQYSPLSTNCKEEPFTPPTMGNEDTISCTSSEVRHELDNFNDSHDEFDFPLNGNLILQNPAYPDDSASV